MKEFENIKKRMEMLRDIQMCTRVINLLESIQKKKDKRQETITLIMNKWLKILENKIVVIFERCKEHLFMWVNVKIPKNEANYINEFFDNEIRKIKGVSETEKYLHKDFMKNLIR